MIFTQQDPGHWLTFSKRADNINLPIQELTRKYNKEKLLFENYVTNFQQAQQALLAQQAVGVGGAGKKYTPLTNSTIQAASYLWFNDRTAAESKYGLIGNWDVSQVTEFEDVFSVPDNGVPNTFNEDISGWDMSNATDLQEMFQGQSNFNQDISNWNVSNVTNFNETFKDCTAYNNGGVSLNAWDTSKIENTIGMFQNASSFNQNIGDWNMSSVTAMDRMFLNTDAFNNGGSDTINTWNTGNVTTFAQMFERADVFNQPIGGWNTVSATSMFAMFYQATLFSQDLTGWCVTNIPTKPTSFDVDSALANFVPTTNLTGVGYSVNSNTPTTSDGSGTGMLVDILAVSGTGVPSSYQITTQGTGYASGDEQIVIQAGSTSNFTFTISTLEPVWGTCP